MENVFISFKTADGKDIHINKLQIVSFQSAATSQTEIFTSDGKSFSVDSSAEEVLSILSESEEKSVD